MKVTTICRAKRQQVDGVVQKESKKYHVLGAAIVRLGYQPPGWDRNRLAGIGTV